MRNILIILIIALSGVFLLDGTSIQHLLKYAFAQQMSLEKPWIGKTVSGAIITPEYLARILADHERLDADRKKGERANLIGADLSGAILLDANLSGANLIGANLNGVELGRANLRGAIFQPDPHSLPTADSIAEAYGLSELWYLGSSQSLVKLRKAFKEAGYRQQEREITCSLKRSDTYQEWRRGGMARLKAAFN